MTDLQAWIGREHRATDRVDEGMAARWCATFDRAVPGDGLMPQGIHLCLCPPQPRTDGLELDGHARRDDNPDSFLPPVPMPRRMWAGSRFAFHAPIAIGAPIARLSRVASITEKSGHSGRLVFVDVVHETHADGALAVSETQTLVYRDAVPANAPLSPPPPGEGRFDPAPWPVHRELTPDSRLLFRYSALTFNAHRIHYDAPYVTAVERYRGLVVHGPLTASLLLQLAGSAFGENRLASFAFRGVSPAIADDPLHLVLNAADGTVRFGAFAGDGRHVMQGEGALA